MADEEMIADYDVRSPASRTLITVVGTIVAVGVLVGLVLGASVLMRDTKVTRTTIDLGSSARIVIDAGSSDVRLVQGSSDAIEISARITSGLRKTDFQIGRRGDEIKILSGCQTWLSPGCGVSSTIELPKGLPVEVRTTSGDVTADSVTEGVLNVTTGSGDVDGTGLRLDELSVVTLSGDVSAVFVRQPFAFKATTRSGDIAGTVPSGKRTYAVRATSRSGDVSSSIDSDEDGEGFVRAVSRSGDISLTTR